MDGIKWEQEMSTSELDVWHVSESNHSKLSTSSFGQFHSGDTYVIRWKYNINQISQSFMMMIIFGRIVAMMMTKKCECQRH